MPPKPPIIRGQAVTQVKAIRAQELRRTMTLAEQKLWQRLRAGRLGGWHFRRQQVIEPYIVDFYCHVAALVIEVDGAIHLTQPEYDQEREEYLQALGLRVIRFTNESVNADLEAVLAAIEQACQQGKARCDNLDEIAEM